MNLQAFAFVVGFVAILSLFIYFMFFSTLGRIVWSHVMLESTPEGE